jgi:hypothetical protein
MTTLHAFPYGYTLTADHSEPRQSVWHVHHYGKLVETFYSRGEALAFIGATVAEIITSDLDTSEG